VVTLLNFMPLDPGHCY